MLKRFGFIILVAGFAATASKPFPDSEAGNDVINVNSEFSLKEAKTKEPILGPWITLKLASLYLSQKRHHEAINILEKTVVDKGLSFWKNTLLAEAYLGTNSVLKATALLETLPPEPKGDANPNQDFYRRIYRTTLTVKNTALEKLGRESEKITARIWALFPDFENPLQPMPPPGARISDKATRLHVLHEKKLFDSVLLFVDAHEIKKSSLQADEKCRALVEWGDSLRQLKKPDSALNAFDSVISENCGADYQAKAFYWKWKLEWKKGDYGAALKTLELFIRKFPDHQYTDDAWHAMWTIYRESKQERSATRAMAALMDLPAGDMKSKILWERAYKAYKKGDYALAVSLLDKITGSVPEDEYFPQALYWKARSLDRIKKSDAGHSGLFYKRIVDEFPFSFYAVMAGHRLGIMPKIHRPSLQTGPSPETGAPDIFSAVDRLNRLKMQKEAANLLDYYTQSEPQAVRTMELFLAQKWIESGDYNQALMMASAHFGQNPFEIALHKDDPMITALYPLAYPEEAGRGYKKTSLPAGIIEGIMREESLFQPEVRSWAGAVGVMQLMPRTAAMQAKKIPLTGFQTGDLTNPATNIILGTSFFEQMAELFGQNIPLAVMAYNAGPGNVKKWLRTNGGLPLDEFIEEIPFSETRGYVKRVIRSAFVYALFSSGNLPEKPLFTMKIR